MCSNSVNYRKQVNQKTKIYGTKTLYKKFLTAQSDY